ncbi:MULTISPECIES: NAD-dependent epimerase/dehydratase family protein [Ramlibacter]|uniref:NAD-dependent epimerase/dehydratase family protein n=1 Tax=Ramlibacter pinisoli TaxID=2682844 RepID=A0A6N8J3F5_9BURK|nr:MULTISPECIES: SDR family oxidoreductase [Ramlibacter]MBA2962917.1 SDR family oxidoreductase [Ramlibacter sp. CGMCC 1.13660]MVQ32860.1 NAD-dependent epimerase/dehydratase family protein [Ramlibacter pinisoli]
MKTVLVTGAGGYIGCVLVGQLLEDGWEVLAVDRFFFGEERLQDMREHPRLRLLVKDVRDLAPADFVGVDAVCDLAALSNDPSGDLDPELTMAINFTGRARVARLAKAAGVRQYVLASSCSVYGKGSGGQLDETSTPHPLTVYAKANLAAEREVLPLACEGFNVTVLRQATVFGLSPRMRFDLIVNLMTLNAVEKGKLFITGGGKQWRPLVHVADTATAFRFVLAAPASKVNGEVFNIGSLNMQVLNVAYTVREAIPFSIEIQVVPDDPDKRSYHVSFDKARRVLGFETARRPEDGVREIYEALKFGNIASEPWTFTVGWYRRLLEAKQLVDKVMLNGRLL